MKLFIFLILISILSYADSTTPVIVELKSGTKQKAQLVTISADTVHLAGKIQGQNTLIKIPLDRFTSITNLSDSSNIALQNWDETEDTVDAEPHPTFGHLVLGKNKVNGLDSTWANIIGDGIFNQIQSTGKYPIVKDSLYTESAIKTNRALGLLTTTWNLVKDSVFVEFRMQWTDSLSIQKTTFKVDNFSHWFYSGEPWKLLNSTLQLNIPISTTQAAPPKAIKATIWVDTDPEGALISLNGQAPACKAPCALSFPAFDTKPTQAEIWASWQVEEHLWAYSTKVALLAGDSIRTLIKLEPSHASLQLISNPPGAEIYWADQPMNTNKPSLGKTPLLLNEFRPGVQKFRVIQKGYKDTILEVIPNPTQWNQFKVDLTPITDPSLRAQQAAQFREKQQKSWGKLLIGLSLGPILVGSTLIWLAESNYSNAAAINEELSLPSSGEGPEFQKKQQESQNATKNGNIKRISGLSLLTVGTVLTTIGFTLSF